LDLVFELMAPRLGLPVRVRHLARLAAALHDTERTHDGLCPDHGLWAAQRRRSWTERVLVQGPLGDEDWAAVAYAVTVHCRQELPPAPEDHLLVARLLKAADALDRVRLAGPGEDPAAEVDVGQLPWPEVAALIPAAVDLLKHLWEPRGGMHRSRRWQTAWSDPEGWNYGSVTPWHP